MNIILYKQRSDRKALEKTLGDPIATLSCELRDPQEVLRPEIIVDASSFIDNWKSVNYARINHFGRYYFVEPMTQTGKIVKYRLTVDPLYSYAESLKNTYFPIARSAAFNSEWYIDAERPIQANHMIYKVKLGKIQEDQSSGSLNYVLTVAGGNA